uniref:ATP synthase complex subunit 8 n=1 Tax=Psedna nana TaxID=1661908 RepID=A0A516IMP0_9ORTH|nr:ATP synthase F0 subunit 8 [Psedna nana]
MPQMAPMMWFTLFIMFSMAMIVFNQMNFFSFKNNPFKMLSKEVTKKTQMSWKW